MQSTTCQGFCQVVRQRLWDCRENHQFCDIILETDSGERVWAHKVVISAGSFGLHGMLVNQNADGTATKDETDGITLLKLPQVTVECLKDVVRFLYLGNVEKFNLESAELWKRYQICEPFRLRDTTVTTEVTSAEAQQSRVEPETADVISQPLPVEIKPEADNESDAPAGAVSSENESLYQVNEEGNTQENNHAQSEEEHLKGLSQWEKSKRKCSTPRRRRIRVYSSSDEDSASSFEEKLASKVSTTPKACTRKLPKRTIKSPTRPAIKSEKVSEEEKLEAEEDIIPSDVEVNDESNSPEEEEWQAPPKRRRGRPPKKNPKPVKPPVKKVRRAKTSKVRTVKTLKQETPISSSSGPLCRTCNIPFETREEYREHRENYHTTGHKCIECGQSFHRVNRLKAHRVEKHPKDGLPPPKWHKCKVEGCDYKSVYADGLDSHYKLVHVKERSICELCGESFCNSYYVTLHKRRVHGDSGPTYPCEDCGTCFYIPKDLKIHRERVHMGKKRFLCDRCPYMSFDKDAVQLHMFSKHKVPLKDHRTVFDCPHCDYKTTAKSVITAHIERHGQKEYKCDQCSSSFPCNRDLKGHIRRKHSNKPLNLRKCPYEGCSYASKYGGPSVLQNHINRMHVNKDYKPWACEVCNYRTNVKGNLHLHLRKVHKLVPNIQQHRVQKMSDSESAVQEQYAQQQAFPQTHVMTIAPINIVPESPQSHMSAPEMYQTVPRTMEIESRPSETGLEQVLSSQAPPTYQELATEDALHATTAAPQLPHHQPFSQHVAPLVHPGAPHSAPPTHPGAPESAPPPPPPMSASTPAPVHQQGHLTPVSTDVSPTSTPAGLPTLSPPGSTGHPSSVARHTPVSSHPAVSTAAPGTAAGAPPPPAPPALPFFPGGQYAMMFPPTTGHNENLFMQGLL